MDKTNFEKFWCGSDRKADRPAVLTLSSTVVWLEMIQDWFEMLQQIVWPTKTAALICLW